MDISIVIVNYNTVKHLKECLNTLLKFSKGFEFEIIVVDNCSPERDIEKIQSVYSDVKFHFRDKNDGFGAGCNYGASFAEGDYLLFVNPDVVFTENINLKLLEYIKTNPSAALISPVYIDDDNETEFTDGPFPGVVSEFNESFDHFFSKLINKLYSTKKKIPANVFEVNWVMGSYMLMPRDLFRKIKGFDECYFLYYEDIDLQLRIKKEGYKILYHPAYSIKHIKRSSVRSYSGENLYYYHMMRSKLIYMNKHHVFPVIVLIKLMHLVGLIIRVITLPIRRSYRNNRKQKLFQYKIKFLQLVSTQKNILHNVFLKKVLLNNKKNAEF